MALKKPKEYLTLLLEFAKFGVFTFGGGWSIISQMQLLYVEQKKTMTNEELLDITSVGRSLPGTMIGNVAMLYGCRTAGLLGGVVCVAGMCLPPMLILIAISFGYDAFRDNYWVSAAMEGIQAAVVPIIACAALGMVKNSIKNWFSILVLTVSVLLYLFADVSVVYLVLFGIVSGLLYGEYTTRRGGDIHGAA